MGISMFARKGVPRYSKRREKEIPTGIVIFVMIVIIFNSLETASFDLVNTL